ncbi:MAG: aminotransferase class V-fold PLP-dependent enzyme [Halobacteria archaeon]
MDPLELREEIPALEDGVYLNTGASGPSPRPVIQRMESAEEEHAMSHSPYDAAHDMIEDAREEVADFLDTSPENICLTDSTTDGIQIVNSFYDWSEDDKVVTNELEHSSGLMTWERLNELHGVEYEILEADDEGRIDLDDVKDAVEDATMFFMSSITWSHGTRLPVEEAVDIAHDAGADAMIDAAQSPGQKPIDIEDWGADYVPCPGHKWILAPWGAGFLYVDEPMEKESPRVGYRGVKDHTVDEWEYEEGAKRFELTSISPTVYAALSTAIGKMSDIGLENVESRIERLTDRFKDQIPNENLASPREFESGIVSFEVDGDPEEFVERAAEEDIVVRTLPYDTVRASIHVFNTESDVDALADLVG